MRGARGCGAVRAMLREMQAGEPKTQNGEFLQPEAMDAERNDGAEELTTLNKPFCLTRRA